MPLKNRLDHAMDAINSVLNQTFRSFELIIIDDGSASEVIVFLEAVEARNDRVRLFRQKGKHGACSCRNVGLDNARGEYLVFLDSDDILAPFCLEERVNAMRSNPEDDYRAYVCLLFRYQPLDRYIVWNRKSNRSQIDNFFQHNAPFQTSGPIWRKSSLQRLGIRWDEELVGWQDWKFHIEALLAGAKGDVEEVIDYFWNQPKKDSISRSSHNYKGRVNRMELLSRFANSQTDLEVKDKINASIIWLAHRMPRSDKLKVSFLLLRLLRGTKYRIHAIMYVYFKSKKIAIFRGIGVLFKQRLKKHVPELFKMIYASSTYKLSVQQEPLVALIDKLNETSDFQKKFW